MPAGPVGEVWVEDSWEDTAWEADAWGESDAGPAAEPINQIYITGSISTTVTVTGEI